MSAAMNRSRLERQLCGEHSTEGVIASYDLETRPRLHVKGIVDIVQRDGRCQRRERNSDVKFFERLLGPCCVLLPSVYFNESNFRLDLHDCVDAFHALVFAQLGAIVEDGGARRGDSTIIVGLEAVIAAALGGPQSTTTSGYRTVSGPVWTAVSLDVVRHPFCFPAGTKAV